MSTGTSAAARLRVGLWIIWASGVAAYYFAYVARALFSRDVTLSFDRGGAAVAVLLVAAVMLACRSAVVTARAAAWDRRLGSRPRNWTLSITLAVAGAFTLPWWMVSSRIGGTLTPLAAPHFPFLGEAIARLTLGAIGASLVCLGALGAGTLVLHLIRLRTGSRVEHLVLATASGFLVISCSAFLLAGLGQYRPAAVAVLIAAACFAGAAARRELVDDQPPHAVIR